MACLYGFRHAYGWYKKQKSVIFCQNHTLSIQISTAGCNQRLAIQI